MKASNEKVFEEIERMYKDEPALEEMLNIIITKESVPRICRTTGEKLVELTEGITSENPEKHRGNCIGAIVALLKIIEIIDDVKEKEQKS